MEIALIIIGIAFILLALIGCFLPILPGPPLAFISLLLLQIGPEIPFSWKFMIFIGVVVVIVTALDYIVPALGAKKWGGSRYGILGAFAGIIVGLFFFPPFGFIVFPMLGAMAGELMRGANTKMAFKAAVGTLVGLLLGSIMKLSVVLVIAYYFFTNL